MARTLLFALSLLCTPGVQAFDEPKKYLIVASPSTGKLLYSELPQHARAMNQSLQVLLETGLKFPQGLAVDHYRKQLYLADPGLKKLVSYPIHHGRSGELSLGQQNVVVDGVETRAVTVDGLGNVMFTEEPTQKKLCGSQLGKSRVVSTRPQRQCMTALCQEQLALLLASPRTTILLIG